jgi:hypothetical protein
MSWGFITTLRNARMDAITTAVGASGRLRLYDGVQPATGGAATNLLCDLPFSATFAPAAAGGILTVNAITTTNAALSGTCTWCRGTTSGGTAIMDAPAGAAVTTTVTGSASTDTVTVGSATGLVIGMYASGTGIATVARIVDIQGTTVHLSVENSGAVSGTGTFNWDLVLTPAALTAGQPVSISAFTITDANQ